MPSELNRPLSADISISGTMPADASGAVISGATAWGDDPRNFGVTEPIAFHWAAPGALHQPLYFEDVNLERGGHSWGMIQPVVSAAHFFSRVPSLPYQLATHPIGECVYTLGHYRPGSCAPYLRRRPRIKSAAGLFQAGITTGLVFLIP